MEIHHFPEVQILGNHAKIREGRHYIDLGFYNSDGTFEWSPEGEARRAAILKSRVPTAEEPAVEEPSEEKTIDPLEAELAAARERNTARNKKQTHRGR